MSDLLKDLTSFHWWMGVVIVGILINLASDYLKPRADGILGFLSVWYATRTERRRQERQERINKYVEDRGYRPYLFHMEVVLTLRSIVLLILSFASDLLALYLSPAHQAYNNNAFTIISSIIVFFMGAYCTILFLRNFLSAVGCSYEIVEARNRLDDRRSRRTRSTNNA